MGVKAHSSVLAPQVRDVAHSRHSVFKTSGFLLHIKCVRVAYTNHIPLITSRTISQFADLFPLKKPSRICGNSKWHCSQCSQHCECYNPSLSTQEHALFHSQNKFTEAYATLPSGMSVLEAEINCENVLLN